MLVMSWCDVDFECGFEVWVIEVFGGLDWE